MNYRVASEFQAPFRVFPYIEEVSNYKLELLLKVKALFLKTTVASYVIIKFAVPKTTSSVHNELAKVIYITIKIYS
jgi:AP-4 complex subunit mu-1